MTYRVNQRGSSWQAAVNHGGKRYRRQFPTKVEAEFWAQKVDGQLSSGDMSPVTPLDHTPVTVRDLLSEVYEQHWRHGKSAKSVKLNIEQVMRVLGNDLKLSHLTQRQVDQMVDHWMTQGLSNATINRRLAVLSKALKHAQERDYIARAPRIKRLREHKHRTRYISEGEERAMLQYFETVHQPDYADYIQVAIDTGMRVSEQLGLTPDNIHLKDGMILLHEGSTKNDDARSIPMTDRVQAIMERRCVGLSKGAKVFGEMNAWNLRYHWDRMREMLGLKEDAQFVPHCMRHTFCSRLVQRGVDLAVVKQLAGHKTLAVTLRYSHLQTDNLREAMQKLN